MIFVELNAQFYSIFPMKDDLGLLQWKFFSHSHRRASIAINMFSNNEFTSALGMHEALFIYRRKINSNSLSFQRLPQLQLTAFAATILACPLLSQLHAPVKSENFAQNFISMPLAFNICILLLVGYLVFFVGAISENSGF